MEEEVLIWEQAFFRDYVMVGLIFNILFSLVYNYINIKDCIANLQIKLQKREFDCNATDEK